MSTNESHRRLQGPVESGAGGELDFEEAELVLRHHAYSLRFPRTFGEPIGCPLPEHLAMAIRRRNLSKEQDSVYRGAEPDRFLSRRFFNLGGSFFRVPATTACFMSTQDLGVSIRSNHSSLPSSGARTTDPWQIF